MSNKSKNIALIVGFLLLIVLSYKLAIAKTFELKGEYEQLKQKELVFKNAPKQLSLLKQKQRHYDSILAKYQLHKGSLQNNLLQTITVFAKAENIKVAGFKEPHLSAQNEMQIKTYQFTLEGNFNAILALIHKLEQQTKFGEIINLHFEKKKNFKSGRHYLQASVLLKSFG